jgi:hypothetical protein
MKTNWRLGNAADARRLFKMIKFDVRVFDFYHLSGAMKRRPQGSGESVTGEALPALRARFSSMQVCLRCLLIQQCNKNVCFR